MRRRKAFQLIPLSLASFGSLIHQAAAFENGKLFGSNGEEIPLSLQYPTNIINMVTDVCKTQGEKLLESAYVISRKILNGNTCWFQWDQGHTNSGDTFQGFNRKICPISGILIYTINWVISIELVEEIKRHTGGNIPGVYFSGALKWGNSWNAKMRSMMQDRGY